MRGSEPAEGAHGLGVRDHGVALDPQVGAGVGPGTGEDCLAHYLLGQGAVSPDVDRYAHVHGREESGRVQGRPYVDRAPRALGSEAEILLPSEGDLGGPAADDRGHGRVAGDEGGIPKLAVEVDAEAGRPHGHVLGLAAEGQGHRVPDVVGPLRGAPDRDLVVIEGRRSSMGLAVIVLDRAALVGFLVHRCRDREGEIGVADHGHALDRHLVRGKALPIEKGLLLVAEDFRARAASSSTRTGSGPAMRATGSPMYETFSWARMGDFGAEGLDPVAPRYVSGKYRPVAGGQPREKDGTNRSSCHGGAQGGHVEHALDREVPYGREGKAAPVANLGTQDRAPSAVSSTASTTLSTWEADMPCQMGRDMVRENLE